MVARLKFKVNEGIVPPGVECAVQFDPTRENLPGPDIVRIDRLQLFLDSMGGGAWPFLVGGVICLVNSVNERDPRLLNSCVNASHWRQLLRGTFGD